MLRVALLADTELSHITKLFVLPLPSRLYSQELRKGIFAKQVEEVEKLKVGGVI